MSKLLEPRERLLGDAATTRFDFVVLHRPRQRDEREPVGRVQAGAVGSQALVAPVDSHAFDSRFPERPRFDEQRTGPDDEGSERGVREHFLRQNLHGIRQYELFEIRAPRNPSARKVRCARGQHEPAQVLARAERIRAYRLDRIGAPDLLRQREIGKALGADLPHGKPVDLIGNDKQLCHGFA